MVTMILMAVLTARVITHSESLKIAIKRVTTLDGLENYGNIKTTINTAVDSILLVTTTMPICKLSRPPSMKLLRRPNLEGWQQSRQYWCSLK